MRFKLQLTHFSQGSLVILMIDRKCDGTWECASEEEMEIFTDTFMK